MNRIQWIKNGLLRLAAFFSQTWHLAALAATFLGFQAVVLPQVLDQILLLSGNTMIFDLRLWYNPLEAQESLRAFGEQGRELYLIAEWTVDLVYPLVYTLLFSGIIFRLRGGELIFFPFLLGMADLLENLSITFMLVRFPDFSPIAAQVATAFTFVKWCLLAGAVTIILILAIARLRKRWLRSFHIGQ